ncbi:hypothetical protein [Candidatus Pyrohabitans sp.]
MTSAVAELLKPDRKRVVAALTFPGLIELSGYLWLHLLVPPDAMIAPAPKLPLITLVVSYLLSAVIYYPFVCSGVVLLEYRWRRERIPAGLKKLAVAGIILLNPLSLRIIVFLPFIILSLFTPAQGLYVEEVIPGAPAAEFDNKFLEGRTIYMLNETEVKTIDDARKFLASAKDGDLVVITTRDASSGSLFLRKCNSIGINDICIGIKVKDGTGAEAVL